MKNATVLAWEYGPTHNPHPEAGPGPSYYGCLDSLCCERLRQWLFRMHRIGIQVLAIGIVLRIAELLCGVYVIRHLSRLHIAAKLSKDNTRKNKNKDKDKDGTGTVVLLHKYTWYLFFCVMVIGMIG